MTLPGTGNQRKNRTGECKRGNGAEKREMAVPLGPCSVYSEKPMVKPKEMSLNISSKNVSM